MFSPSLLAPHVLSSEHTEGWWVLEINGRGIVRSLALLKDHSTSRCLQLTDITAIDYLARSPRFDVVYHMLSHTWNFRVRIKVAVGSNIPSVTSIFPCALWYEREVFDLFGIHFDKSPDQRRILSDYGFEGHPLRKDFPLTGYVQVTYNKASQKVENEPVHLDQPYREFHFSGGSLPGDEKAR